MDSDLRLLFHELVELPYGERERVLRERRVGPELRAEVESLLQYDPTGARNPGDCVSDAAGAMLASAAGPEFGSCGPYRLVRLLGSGGMGTVYLGERADGEIQQQVAVKLLRIDSQRPAWRERFLRERRILASLHHPSIVQVLDAGHTGDGRPYLVMEYVEGVPLDAYAAKIAVRDRLTLFLEVCEGVSHAHRHLIIHRDLKPSNILVNAAGQCKLLDFGIARLLEEAGDPTQTIERLLTPNYASPEQLCGAPQTTATDVYSLGAVLYQLLTGRPPRGAWEIAAAGRLNPILPSDLCYILRKALRDEPEERFVSVEALASDIRAFLESRPVEARSGSAWYRTRKFLRRYWVPAAAAVLVTASLSAGLYLANRERVVAQRRFAELRQLSNKVFELDAAIRNLPGSTQARQRLVSASLEYLEGLAAGARGDLDLAQELGDAYARVARVQGVPTELNLGEFAQAEANLKKADGFIESVLAARPQDRKALYRSAIIAHDRMILADSERRSADALVFARKAAQRFDAFMRRGDASEAERENLAAMYGNIALAYVNLHLYNDAVPYARRVVEIARPIPSARYRVGQGLSLLANALRYQGDLDGALEAIREARKLAVDTVYTSETRRMIDLYGVFLREGLILGEDGGVSLGRSAEAIAPLREALDLTEAAARRDPHDSTSRSRAGTAGRELGNILRRRDPRGALSVYDAALQRLSEIPENLKTSRDRAMILASSSYALRSLGRAAPAKQRIDTAFAILERTGDYPAARIALESEDYTALSALADYYAGEGDPRRALETYEDLLARVMAGDPDPFSDLRDTPRLARVYQALAALYRRTGDATRAEAYQARRLDLWRRWDLKLPGNVFIRAQLEAAARP